MYSIEDIGLGFIDPKEAYRILSILRERNQGYRLRGADLWGFDLAGRNIEVVTLDKNQEYL